nr:zinc-ribbon domain-containing protein [Liquorilactobacillus satsumensis]
MASETFCPECGTQVKAGAAFCPNCGHNLTSAATEKKSESTAAPEDSTKNRCSAVRLCSLENRSTNAWLGGLLWQSL